MSLLVEESELLDNGSRDSSSVDRNEEPDEEIDDEMGEEFNEEWVEMDEESDEESIKETPFQPEIADVMAVKEILLRSLPIELVDLIIDLAEYWPHTHVSLKHNQDRLQITAGPSENRFLLRSFPLGYVPKKIDPSNPPSLSQSFVTCPPNPGLNYDECLQECTDKTLLQWAEESCVRGEFPCRKIVFTIKSHDQGWGGDHEHRGTYVNSYTWFDVGKEEACMFEKSKQPPSSYLKDDKHSCDKISGIENSPHFMVSHSIASRNESSGSTDAKDIMCVSRTIYPKTTSMPAKTPGLIPDFVHSLIPDEDCLQRNVVAKFNVKKHVVVWSCKDNIDPGSEAADDLERIGRGRATANGEFVRSLRLGQIVTIWGKSRFPGWINHVNKVQIDVYWAV